MKLSRKVDLPAFPRNPGGVVLLKWRRFLLKLRELERIQCKEKNCTAVLTKSTKAENLLDLQRLRKKEILDELVAAFPAGNSFTLVVSHFIIYN